MSSAPKQNPMTCEEAEELLPLVAEGLIDADSDPALFDHLADCDYCLDSLALHDLCTEALNEGETVNATKAQAEVIHLQLSRPLAACASIAAAALIAVLAWSQFSPAQQGVEEQTTQHSAPEMEIVQELPRLNPLDEPRYRVRIGDDYHILNLSDLDRRNAVDNNQAGRPQTSVSVGHQR